VVVHDDATCPFRGLAEELTQKLAIALQRIEALEKQAFGKKSEKMTPVSKALAQGESAEAAEAKREAGLAKRRARQALKEALRKQMIVHHVTEAQAACPACGDTANKPVGAGKSTTIYEYVPGYFVQQEHVQEKLACRCGGFIATADPPRKVALKGRYGPGFIAHLCVMKCADSIPLYRLAKQYERIGIPMTRQTLTDLFHAAAEKLTPLADRLLALIAQCPVVQADETPIKMQNPKRRGYVWTFVADDLIGYAFAPSRSGDTPVLVLGGSQGTLVVDAYTGYNRVTAVGGRDRAGCLAHVRRKFFDARGSAQVEADETLALILAVYRVEHEVKQRGLVRTDMHLDLRQTAGRDAMDALHAWLIAAQPRHGPKTSIGNAIGYALGQWPYLMRFLGDVRIPPDNNASERALRVVALGRKNFLFVGDEGHGEHLAVLYSLIATCEAHDIDPTAYLRDVLLRIDVTEPADFDDLLPHRWQQPDDWLA